MQLLLHHSTHISSDMLLLRMLTNTKVGVGRRISG